MNYRLVCFLHEQGITERGQSTVGETICTSFDVAHKTGNDDSIIWQDIFPGTIATKEGILRGVTAADRFAAADIATIKGGQNC